MYKFCILLSFKTNLFFQKEKKISVPYCISGDNSHQISSIKSTTYKHGIHKPSYNKNYDLTYSFHFDSFIMFSVSFMRFISKHIAAVSYFYVFPYSLSLISSYYLIFHASYNASTHYNKDGKVLDKFWSSCVVYESLNFDDFCFNTHKLLKIWSTLILLIEK